MGEFSKKGVGWQLPPLPLSLPSAPTSKHTPTPPIHHPHLHAHLDPLIIRPRHKTHPTLLLPPLPPYLLPLPTISP
jgi:hypothetical protein